MNRTLISALAAAIVAFGAGFLAGSARSGSGQADEHRGEEWGELPREITRDRPLIDEITAKDYRLLIFSCGEPVKLLRRQCLLGNFELAVLDREDLPVYSTSNGSGYEDCRLDYSEFVASRMIKLVYYTWDVRSIRPQPWKIEVVVLRPGKPPETSTRIALKAQPGDDRAVARLVAEVRPALAASPGPEADRLREKAARSLNQLRNIGIGRPDEVLAALRSMNGLKGSLGGALRRYIEQLEVVKEVSSSGQVVGG